MYHDYILKLEAEQQLWEQDSSDHVDHESCLSSVEYSVSYLEMLFIYEPLHHKH